MVDLDRSRSETSVRFLAVPMLIVDAISKLVSGITLKLPTDDVSVVLAVPNGRDGCRVSDRSDWTLCVPRLESRDCDADESGLPLGGSDLGGPNRPWLLERDLSWISADLGRPFFFGVLCGSLFLVLRLSRRDSSYSD